MWGLKVQMVKYSDQDQCDHLERLHRHPSLRAESYRVRNWDTSGAESSDRVWHLLVLDGEGKDLIIVIFKISSLSLAKS